MGLREDLLRGIYAYGFEKPSAIQQRAIKPVSLFNLVKGCHRHLSSIDCLMAHTACFVCFISTVNCHSEKKRKIGQKCGSSSRHITNLKQSIFFRYLWRLLTNQKCTGWFTSIIIFDETKAVLGTWPEPLALCSWLLYQLFICQHYASENCGVFHNLC
jgi:hypothetical protein